MATEPTVSILYVDGTQETANASDWALLRPDGVDEVAVGFDVFTHISGQSIYWLYFDGDNFIFGGAAAGYDAIPPEIIVTGQGHFSRGIEFMPDLHHSNVKLGWWKRA